MKKLLTALFVALFMVGCGGDEAKEKEKAEAAERKKAEAIVAAAKDDPSIPDGIDCSSCGETVSKHADKCLKCGHPSSLSIEAYKRSIVEAREINKRETRASFFKWTRAITSYKSDYKHYPPLFSAEEPLDLSESDNGAKFIMALSGRKLVDDNWQPLSGDDLRYNRNSRKFHAFDEEEFDEDNHLVDAWGNRAIQIIVDYDRDGFIKLPVDEEIDELDGRSIKKDIVIYVLGKDDPNGRSLDVFSWDAGN